MGSTLARRRNNAGRPSLARLVSIAQVHHRATAYVGAVLAVICSVLLRMALTPLWGAQFPFLTCYPAVVIAAYLGGLAPGLLATGLSAIAVALFWFPQPMLFGHGTEPLALSFFVGSGTMIGMLMEWRHRATTARDTTEEALERSSERLRILHQIDRGIIEADAPQAIAEAALRGLQDLLGVPRAIVNLFDLEAGEAEWLAAAGRRRMHLGPGVRFPLRLMGDVEALRRGEMQLIDVRVLPRSAEADALLASGVQTYMVVPMIARGELIGAVSFGGAPGAYSAEQLEIAHEVAAQMAITIAQARLYERARENEIRYRTLVEGSIQGIVVQQDNIIRFANTAMARIVGYERGEDLIGRDVLSIPAPHERPRLAEYAASRLIGAPVPSRYVFEAIRQDGTPVWLETLSSVVSWGGTPAILATLFDITEQKHLEEQLRQSQKLEAIGSLAGGVAHDFNNLLTVIGGRSQIVGWKLPPDSEIRHDLELIDQAAERAAGLTRQLLAFSRKQVLEPRVLDLSAIVQTMTRILQRLIGEHIELVAESDPQLWLVRADPSQIEQVILNLGVNARDAMPQGGRLTIETQNVELDDAYARLHAGVVPGPHVLLAVSDTGHGMDPEIQAKIFDPFFTTKEPGKGTGLGLSTVYGIVKQSGGHVWVYSEVGQGSTFAVYLPSVQGAAEAARPAPTEVARGTETILVVEDDDQVRALARESLALRGYVVLEASHPRDALAVERQHAGTIHLLLTDVVMPGESGPGVAARLQQLRPALKILFMSGYPAGAIVHHNVLEPGISFLHKPFTPETLTRKVREVLDLPQ